MGVRCRTVRLHLDTVEKLLKLKQHPRETYDDVVKRLIKFYEEHGGKQ